MIIDAQKSSNMEVYGEITSKKATIDSGKLAKLQYILTEGLYSDPMSAVIVEIANNAMDSVIESGKDPILNPVMINIERDPKAGWNNYKFSVKDNGIGMTKQFFQDVFMSMLSSTKEDSNSTIGHFGIG